MTKPPRRMSDPARTLGRWLQALLVLAAVLLATPRFDGQTSPHMTQLQAVVQTVAPHRGSVAKAVTPRGPADGVEPQPLALPARPETRGEGPVAAVILWAEPAPFDGWTARAPPGWVRTL